jgi:hypothetical protein
MDGALEAVEGGGLITSCDREGLVVVVAAGIANRHDELLWSEDESIG